MNYRLLVSTFAVALLTLASATSAQEQKVQVSVEHSGTDTVGKQFVYALREALRGSNGFRLVTPDESGMQLKVVSIDPERAQTSGGYWTVASVTYTMTNFIPYQKGNPQTWYPIYLTSQVLTVGSQRVDEQAKSVIATLDEQLERYRSDLKK